MNQAAANLGALIPEAGVMILAQYVFQDGTDIVRPLINRRHQFSPFRHGFGLVVCLRFARVQPNDTEAGLDLDYVRHKGNVRLPGEMSRGCFARGKGKIQNSKDKIQGKFKIQPSKGADRPPAREGLIMGESG